jgi:hypothetical protein
MSNGWAVVVTRNGPGNDVVSETFYARVSDRIYAQDKRLRRILLRDFQLPEIPVQPKTKIPRPFRLVGRSLPRFPGRAFGFASHRSLPRPGFDFSILPQVPICEECATA